MQHTNKDLEQILSKLADGMTPSKEDLVYLLGLSRQADTDALFKAAREVRHQCFGNDIFLYGFLYFSTYCRNECRFCQYKKSNIALPRYRKTASEIMDAAKALADSGVHLLDLTMGEDPELYYGEQGFASLVNIVRKVREETQLPVMISPGTVPDDVIRQMADSGVDFYACYQETFNRELYKRLRPGQPFEVRRHKKEVAGQAGMLVEEGILTGLGESLEDIADAVIQMTHNGVHQVRVMTFVPQSGTPMADRPAQDNQLECLVIAVMRLVLQDRLIPASLDVDGLSGLEARLNAGANVVTSIVPPKKGLAGVANNSLDIEESRRSVDMIRPVLNACGVDVAGPRALTQWIEAQHRQTGPVSQEQRKAG